MKLYSPSLMLSASILNNHFIRLFLHSPEQLLQSIENNMRSLNIVSLLFYNYGDLDGSLFIKTEAFEKKPCYANNRSNFRTLNFH